MILAPGLIYYWISWILWTIATCFYKKSITRTQLTYLLLMILVFSTSSIKIGKYFYTLSYVIVFIVSFLFVIKVPRLPLKLIITTIISFSYLTILSIELFEPIWMIFPSLFLVSAVCFTFSVLFIKTISEQLITLSFSMCIGELLYHYVILPQYVLKQIGDLIFFDQLFLTIGLLYFVHIGKKGIKLLYIRTKVKQPPTKKRIKIPS